MLNIKLTKANTFNRTPLTTSNIAAAHHYKKAVWVNVINCKNEIEVITAYKGVLSSISSKNIWTLLVNPENKLLDKIVHSNTINSAKILKIDAQKIKIDIDNILRTLRNGNCSSVTLCNPTLSQKQLSLLEAAAKKGNTRCTIINSKPTIH